MAPIPRETSADQPSITNVGPEMPLDSLADEYPYNPYLRRQILEWLPAHGPIRGWRRIRGDGNCYYRSFIVGVLDGPAGMYADSHVSYREVTSTDSESRG